MQVGDLHEYLRLDRQCSGDDSDSLVPGLTVAALMPQSRSRQNVLSMSPGFWRDASSQSYLPLSGSSSSSATVYPLQVLAQFFQQFAHVGTP